MVRPESIKSALITGITGSGGSYVAEYLVDHQPHVKVHGISNHGWPTGELKVRPKLSTILAHVR
mgnify:CR=1 FL=1